MENRFTALTLCRLCNGQGRRVVKVPENSVVLLDPIHVLAQYVASPKYEIVTCCDCNGTGIIESTFEELK